MKRMGATGHGLFKYSRTGNVNTETFGIKGAVNYKGRIPRGKGLDDVGANKITLKVASDLPQDIYFQFKLTKNNKLSINGYDPNMPESRAHLIVSAIAPSLAATDFDRSEEREAQKLRRMMAKSTKISEAQLQQIAARLLQHKKNRG